MEWSSNPEKKAETNLEQVYIPSSTVEKKSGEEFVAIKKETYIEQDAVQAVNSPSKNIIATLILIGVGLVITLGFINDIRYLYIIGLSLLGLCVLSIIVGIARHQRMSFWDAMILSDLVEILAYIILGIIKLVIEIIADS